MDLEAKSLLPSADEQENASSMELNKSTEMFLLTECQSQVEGAVIIYDAASQEIAEEDKSSEDPDNFITLHASTDTKSEVQEESVKVENLSESIKTSPEKNEEPENDTDDDETIATFLTSTGQQLALYAVEDSDEIFAVALYDESGEPPTNFHFLMKADVERLIGEGAVKTVKKPQGQPKKESKPTDKKEEIKFETLSDLRAKAEREEAAAAQLKKVQNEIKTEIIEVPGPQPKASTPKTQVKVVQKGEQKKTVATPNHNLIHKNLNTQRVSLVTKPTKAVGTVSQSTKTVSNISQPTKTLSSVSQATKAVSNVSLSTKAVSNVCQPTKAISNISQPMKAVSNVSQPTISVSNVSQPTITISNVSQPTITVSNVSQPKTTISHISQPTKTVSNVSQLTKVVSNVYPPAKTVSNVYKPTKAVSNVYQSTKTVSNIYGPTKAVTNVYQPAKAVRNVYQPAKSISNVYQSKKAVSNVYQPGFEKKISEVKKESNVAYVVANSSLENQYIIDHAIEDLDSDAEIVEQSTVQYILCDGDPSDTEMTFDELQASLKSFKTNKSMSNVNKSNIITPQKPEKKKENIIRYSSFIKTSPKVAPILCQKKEPVTTVYRTYSKSPKKVRMTNNLLHPVKKIKQEIVDPSYGDISNFDDGMSSDDFSKNPSKQDVSMADSSPGKMKVKRCRKQQLTTVNRTDSEIIIQPASAYSEEDDEPTTFKRRGRRKKKAAVDPDYNPRKPMKKAKKPNRSVEVIEIDVDESERSGAHDSTVGSSKGKGSSDKENDIISVNDSGNEEEEDEEEEEQVSAPKKVKTSMMQCTDCNRNFRKRKALEKHVQACPKSPAYIQKMEEKKQLAALSGKRFQCKSCDEMFDIAVSLARHVRVMHTLKKKGKQPKGWSKIERSTSSEREEEEELMLIKRIGESSPEPELGKKRRGRPPGKKNITNDSPSSNIELKLDSSTETLHQEPKRRGRPPGRKSIYKERSLTPDLDEIEASATESSTEKQSLSPELRKRGRPGKQSISKERSTSPEPGDKSEDTTAVFVQLPKKRGRPAKRNTSKDEELETLDAEDKNESSTENEKVVESTPSKKRGRPRKSSLSKDNRSVSPEVDEKDESSDEIPLEARKRARLRKVSFSKDDRTASSGNEKKNESSDEMPLQARKKAKMSKTNISNDDSLVTPEAEEKNESSDETPLEARKKTKISKTSLSKDDSSLTPETEEKNDKSDEMPLEARKKVRIAKQSISKNDRSVTPEVKDKDAKVTEEKSEEKKEARSETPNSQKKEEEMVESKEQTAEIPVKDITEKPAQESKEKPIAEPPKKRKVSKDESSKIDDTKTEEKTESLVESSPEARKRGRLAKSKSVKENESETAEVEEKIEESTSETAEESSRKKSKSTKESVSTEEESEVPKAEEKPENSAETPSETRKRGRPSKARPSIEDEAEAPLAEEKTESSTETPTEPRKRGRPSKASTSVEEEPEIPETEEKDKPARKVSDTSSQEVRPETPRKRGRPGKERPSKDEEPETTDAEEKTESVIESPRKRGRPVKDRSSKSESVDDLAAEEVEKKEVESQAIDDKDKAKTKKKIPSPNRTWKVKKLNCEDCGKWFSSATLLRTHRLQHRTKKSARLDADRCPLCRKAIRGDLFAKHMATVHKKKSPTVAVGAARRAAKPPTKSRSARTLRSSS